MDTSRYKQQWEIESFSDPGRTYTVSECRDGAWACDCKGWIFSGRRNGGVRLDCKHILSVKKGLPRLRPTPAIAQPGARTAPAAPAEIVIDDFRIRPRRAFVDDSSIEPVAVTRKGRTL